MIVKITILLWFICIVWRFFVIVHYNSMSISEQFALEMSGKVPFYRWGLGLLMLITIIMSFASLIWWLFMR